jgi:hypothetical protein
MSTKFQISHNTTITPPMVYPSAWWREQKAGDGGVHGGRVPLGWWNQNIQGLQIRSFSNELCR